MRTPQIIDPLTESVDDGELIFGSPRSHSTGYYHTRNRPSMISSKYKRKEDRRRVLKVSLNKLKKIDDPEANLCRSVLINNTIKVLQQETRSEKMQKQQSNYPKCYNDSFLNIKTEFLKNEHAVDEIIAFSAETNRVDDLITSKEFHVKLEEEIKHASANKIQALDSLVINVDTVTSDTSHQQQNNLFLSKKRTFSEMEECDMHDILSQFYLPPTPRMLTGIDEDEDVNLVIDNTTTKRLKHEDQASTTTNKNSSDLVCHTTFSNYSNSVSGFINNNLPLSRYSNSCVVESVESKCNPFSCGHASMLGDLQSNYHNLITSLET